jgi:hypothetical protein
MKWQGQQFRRIINNTRLGLLSARKKRCRRHDCGKNKLVTYPSEAAGGRIVCSTVAALLAYDDLNM